MSSDVVYIRDLQRTCVLILVLLTSDEVVCIFQPSTRRLSSRSLVLAFGQGIAASYEQDNWKSIRLDSIHKVKDHLRYSF
jgi:hypothetical protein